MKKPTENLPAELSHLAGASIAICGLAQNCATKLKGNIDFIGKLRTYFTNSVVIVVENGSMDATRKILDEWAAIDAQVFIVDGKLPPHISEFVDVESRFMGAGASSTKGPNPYYSRKRITKMVALRNQYLEKLASLNQYIDYLLVLDFDVDCISLEGVLDSFAKADQWDVVTAYGYSTSPFLQERYHDTYALIPLENISADGEKILTQTEASIKQLQRKWKLNKNQHELIPVYAAFGGLSIYKYPLVAGLKYQILSNEDERVEVRCEHVSLCQQLHLSGKSMIMVNPKMHLRFQSIGDAIKKINNQSLADFLRSLRFQVADQ